MLFLNKARSAYSERDKEWGPSRPRTKRLGNLMRKPSLILMILLCFALTGYVQAQQYGEFIQVVIEQIFLVSQDEGQIVDIHIRILARDGTHEYLIAKLSPGKYKIFAVCDQDCDDINLCAIKSNTSMPWSAFVNAGNGNDNCDKLEDDLPIKEVTLMEEGSIAVATQMKNCKEDFCYYGVAILKIPENKE